MKDTRFQEFRNKLKEKEQEKMKEKQNNQEEFSKFKDFWNKLKQEEEERYNVGFFLFLGDWLNF